jgi:sugar transferase EpsL
MYFGKRAVDLAIAILTCPVWVPTLIVCAIAVRIRLGAPVTFRQPRAGLGGVPFDILKLRTMTDARDEQGRLLPDAVRLRPFGAWLRSTSLDELPELINVLRGEMSLVGPRPLHLHYLPLYSEKHRHRHDVRPGITGLAQVSGRNAVSWAERFDLDVAYVEGASLALDIKILAATIRVVLHRGGVTAPGEATIAEFRGYGTDA